MSQVKKANWGAFYKYGTLKKIQRIKPIIFESKFYFPSPIQLNDPSDCRNIVNEYSLDEIETFLKRAMRQLNGNDQDDDYIKVRIKAFGAEVVLEEMTRVFNKAIETKYGVFSLARRPDNMALWAKYANDHKGYCLQFSDLSRLFNVYEVRYTEKKPLSLSFDVDVEQADFLFTKSQEWSNEEEARILAKESGNQIFPKSSLKAIILGEKCSTENEEILRGWLKESKAAIVLKKAYYNIAKQKLEFQAI